MTCFFVLSTLGLMSLSLSVDHSYSLQTAEKRNARFHAKAYDAADTGAVSQRGFPSRSRGIYTPCEENSAFGLNL